MNMIRSIWDASSIWISGKFRLKAVCDCVCKLIEDNILYCPVLLVTKQCTVRHCIIMEAGNANLFGFKDNCRSHLIKWRSKD
jgi:hypothetical protein